MKTTTISLFACLILSLNATAQIKTDSVKQTKITKAKFEKRKKEIGVRINSMDFDQPGSFNLVYKKSKRKNPDKYRRFRFLTLKTTLDFQDSEEIASTSLKFGAAFGTERRKTVYKGFKFIYGPEFSFYYSGSFSILDDVKTSHHLDLYYGYALGLQYDFKNNFCINVETIPALRHKIVYKLEEGDSEIHSVVGRGMASNFSFSIMYNFGNI